MKDVKQRLGRWKKAFQVTLIVLGAVLLAFVFVFLAIESRWAQPRHMDKHEAFLRGSTGTELMPLAVFQVLPDMFPENFQPAGKEAGDWIDQFGFNRGAPGINQGLPLGFSISNYRPKSGVIRFAPDW